MIHTNIIAKVERYSGGVADLEPLFLDDDGQQYSKIVNARVLSHTLEVDGGSPREYTPNYRKGDIVMVAVIERDFSDAVNGRRGNGGNDAKHELTSAVIVGKVM